MTTVYNKKMEIGNPVKIRKTLKTSQFGIVGSKGTIENIIETKFYVTIYNEIGVDSHYFLNSEDIEPMM